MYKADIMKRILSLTILFAALFLSGCKKERIDLIPAVLKGFDLRDCACCGGIMVTFPSDTSTQDNTFYLWDWANNQYDLQNDTFPLNVKIRYKLLPQGCAAAKGKIEVIELIKQ